MTSSNEIIDQELSDSQSSSLFKTMTILSFIGNGIWGLLFLLLLIGCIVNGAAVAQSMSLDSFFGGAIAFFAFLSALVVASCVLSVIGVIRMRKGKRKGFFLYAIANGAWALILFYGAAEDGGIMMILGGLISLLFIFYFAMRLGKLSG